MAARIWQIEKHYQPSKLVGLIMVGILACQCAWAQDGKDSKAGDVEDGRILEEVIVTGSRIVRRDFSAPSPVVTIDKDDILTSAQPTLEEALNRMPQVRPDFGRTSNNPGTGKSLVNLRGFGSNRTLVVLNGRRYAPAGIQSFVDINSIPQSLVERVEIVTGGATTVYGSDAVSGVINFLTRQDFEGLELEGSAYITEEGDAQIYDANITWGRSFDGGNGNIAVFTGYLERKSLLQGEKSKDTHVFMLFLTAYNQSQ